MSGQRGPTKRSTERLDLITQAASVEIIRHGFDNLSVSDIAEAAGLSVGGMYRYITTKTDLLVMVCRGIYDGVREQLGEIAAGDESHEAKLRSAIDLYLRECENQRAQIAMVYREYRRLPDDAQRFFMQREKAIADVFADLIRGGCGRGVFQPVDATVLAMDIVFLGHMPSFKKWALLGEVSAEQLRGEQVELVLGRLLPR
ncbi:TetR/AcrR family transcriptional regulator [Pseudonocardia endophytica]|uniref:TetR family transcriptional regulator n=1 Tax=Pseudonocardia endophytica TaxID=401976 RepID=A0A4R1HQS3_PSEEN|nr:TetR/AcrR family transcriptional regulator [Pseudonocardia endophytica]TCK22109.1 TetR family transcriptional regulator [Pseudonocardia endophytica]